MTIYKLPCILPYIILYRYKCICVIIIIYNTMIYNTFCTIEALEGNMPGTKQDLIKNSVTKSYSNSFTYVLNAVETN